MHEPCLRPNLHTRQQSSHVHGELFTYSLEFGVPVCMPANNFRMHMTGHLKCSVRASVTYDESPFWALGAGVSMLMNAAEEKRKPGAAGNVGGPAAQSCSLYTFRRLHNWDVTSRRALPAQRLPRTRRLPAQPVAMLFAWNFSWKCA